MCEDLRLRASFWLSFSTCASVRVLFEKRPTSGVLDVRCPCAELVKAAFPRVPRHAEA
jgi:hypothetical protein